MKTIELSNPNDFVIRPDEVLYAMCGRRSHKFRSGKQLAEWLESEGAHIAFLRNGKSDGHRIYRDGKRIGYLLIELADRQVRGQR